MKSATAQPPGGRAEARQRRALCAQLLGKLPRLRQAHRRHIGRLALLRILAGGLAERGGARRSRARRPPPGRRGRLPWRSGPAVLFSGKFPARGAEQHGGANDRAGLVNMRTRQRGEDRGALPVASSRSAARPPCRASPPRPPASSPSRAARGHRPAGARRAAEGALAAHRRPAARSPRRTARTVGLPRLEHVTSSMHGMSSCTSE